MTGVLWVRLRYSLMMGRNLTGALWIRRRHVTLTSIVSLKSVPRALSLRKGRGPWERLSKFLTTTDALWE